MNKIKKFESIEEFLDYFRKFTQEQLDLSVRKMTDEDSFDHPSWAEFQAYQLGTYKAYKKVLNLIPDKGDSIA